MADPFENSVRASGEAPSTPPSCLGPAPSAADLASFKWLEVTDHSGWIHVVLNSGRHNCLTEEMAAEMASLLATASERDSIHCLVISGGEKRVFSRGLELKSFLAGGVDDQSRFIERSNALLSAIAGAPVPVICAINGVCAGAGLELAIACDVRIAAESATFSSPEVMYGLLPGGGVLQRLLRQVGRGQCMRVLWSGEMIDAAEALRIGLVEEVVRPEMLANRCEQVARRLSRAPRSVLAAMKRSVVEGLDLPMSKAVQLDLRQSVDALRRL